MRKEEGTAVARRQFDIPNIFHTVMAGTIWFIGLGAVGAVSAVTGNPDRFGASIGVMVFGIVGTGILLATLRALRGSDDAQLPQCLTETSSIKIQRRGASKAA
ncbi:MAG: hypothetical protein ACOX87_06605 [Chloroflexota bacterium]